MVGRPPTHSSRGSARRPRDDVPHLCPSVGVAQLVRAPGCGPGGRGFETPRSPRKPVAGELAPGAEYT
jgi:hypothetical protein